MLTWDKENDETSIHKKLECEDMLFEKKNPTEGDNIKKLELFTYNT